MSESGVFVITIRLPHGSFRDKLLVPVGPNTTVRDIKRCIARKCAFGSVDAFQLHCAGVVLRDMETTQSAGITAASVVHLGIVARTQVRVQAAAPAFTFRVGTACRNISDARFKTYLEMGERHKVAHVTWVARADGSFMVHAYCAPMTPDEKARADAVAMAQSANPAPLSDATQRYLVCACILGVDRAHAAIAPPHPCDPIAAAIAAPEAAAAAAVEELAVPNPGERDKFQSLLAKIRMSKRHVCV